jgi:hypothetical protein
MLAGATSLSSRPVGRACPSGLVAMGESIEEAVANALRGNRLAEVAMDLAGSAASPDEKSLQEMADLPDLGAKAPDFGFWQHHGNALTHWSNGLMLCHLVDAAS